MHTGTMLDLEDGDENLDDTAEYEGVADLMNLDITTES